MSKAAFYFSHDSGASRDPKCAALISDFGPAGYGLWWMIVEALSEEDGYKFKKFPKLMAGLSQRFGATVEQCSSIVQAMLNDYKLLLEDDNFIWSESLLRRMEEKESKRLKRVEAGRIGGTVSATKTKQCSSNAQATVEQSSSTMQAKPSKVKEMKVKENVFLTPTESFKLIDLLGESAANERLQAFSDSKLAHGYKYKSDYHAIITWMRNDEKKKAAAKNLNTGNDGRDTRDYDRYTRGKHGHVVQ